MCSVVSVKNNEIIDEAGNARKSITFVINFYAYEN